MSPTNRMRVNKGKAKRSTLAYVPPILSLRRDDPFDQLFSNAGPSSRNIFDSSSEKETTPKANDLSGRTFNDKTSPKIDQDPLLYNTKYSPPKLNLEPTNIKIQETTKVASPITKYEEAIYSKAMYNSPVRDRMPGDPIASSTPAIKLPWDDTSSFEIEESPIQSVQRPQFGLDKTLDLVKRVEMKKNNKKKTRKKKICEYQKLLMLIQPNLSTPRKQEKPILDLSDSIKKLNLRSKFLDEEENSKESLLEKSGETFNFVTKRRQNVFVKDSSESPSSFLNKTEKTRINDPVKVAEESEESEIQSSSDDSFSSPRSSKRIEKFPVSLSKSERRNRRNLNELSPVDSDDSSGSSPLSNRRSSRRILISNLNVIQESKETESNESFRRNEKSPRRSKRSHETENPYNGDISDVSPHEENLSKDYISRVSRRTRLRRSDLNAIEESEIYHSARFEKTPDGNETGKTVRRRSNLNENLSRLGRSPRRYTRRTQLNSIEEVENYHSANSDDSFSSAEETLSLRKINGNIKNRLSLSRRSRTPNLNAIEESENDEIQSDSDESNSSLERTKRFENKEDISDSDDSSPLSRKSFVPQKNLIEELAESFKVDDLPSYSGRKSYRKSRIAKSPLKVIIESDDQETLRSPKIDGRPSSSDNEDLDEDTFETDNIPNFKHFVFPAGKKYRRSLSIIKHIDGDVTHNVPKGRNYENSVAQVIQLQSTGEDSNISSVEVKKRLSVRRLSLIRETTPRKRKTRFTTVESFSSPSSVITKNLSFLSRISSYKSLQKDKNLDLDQHEKYCEGVFTLCQQTEPMEFDQIFNNGCRGECKLGEGVFGEVFMVSRDERKNVMKIMPIEGDFPVNEEPQKKYSEIFSELMISIMLDDLRCNIKNFTTMNFVEVVSAKVVRGRYPQQLVQLWNDYDQEKGSSNDNVTVFGDSQLYIALELANGGEDLETYSFSTARQALSIFQQIAFSLAVAEECLQFEHRDLHWGNILISRTPEKKMRYVIGGKEFFVITSGVKATIIDYTLSRAFLAEEETPFFYDLNKDPELFMATGDYQFEIYRQMKLAVNGDWSSFQPKTNVLWLHYVVDKMIKEVTYKRTVAKIHKDSIKTLTSIESWILQCQSSYEVALKVI